jgi:hypothetical protein
MIPQFWGAKMDINIFKTQEAISTFDGAIVAWADATTNPTSDRRKDLLSEKVRAGAAHLCPDRGRGIGQPERDARGVRTQERSDYTGICAEDWCQEG